MPTQHLHGWKDIAGYLGKSVRAAQRWEKQLKLPVHRMPTHAGHAIYAIPEEIDAWRTDAERRHGLALHRFPGDDDGDDQAAADVVADEHDHASAATTADTLHVGDIRTPDASASTSRVRVWRAVVVATSLVLGLILTGMATIRVFRGDTPVQPLALAAEHAFDTGPWPVRGGDGRRSGQSRLTGPSTALRRRIIFDAGAVFPTPRPLVATSMGTFIVATCDGRVIAFDVSGRVHWTQTLDRSLNAEAASGLAVSKSWLLVSVDDCPHAPHTTARTHFTALDVTSGRVAFRHQTGAQEVPVTIGKDGTFYQADQYGTLRAYDRLGSVLWALDLPGFGLLPPLQAADGTLLLVGDGAAFGQSSRHAARPDGRMLWSQGDGAFASVALATNGDIVAVDFGVEGRGEDVTVPSVRRFSSAGPEIWRLPVPEGFQANPRPELATPGNGDILVRSATHLIAIDASGTVRWRVPLPAGGGAPGPVVDRNGDIYITSGDRALSFTPAGRVRWDVPVTLATTGGDTSPGATNPGTAGRLIIGAEGLLLVMMERSVVGLQ